MNLKVISLLDFYQPIEEYVKSQNPELTSPKTIRKKARDIFLRNCLSKNFVWSEY